MGDGFGRIVSAFARAAGPEIARIATPVSLKDGVLRVRCSSASWAQSLRFNEGELLPRLNAALPGYRIERLHATAGGIQLADPAVEREQRTAARRGVLAELDEQAQHRLDELVAGIADPALRQRVRAAAEASARRAMTPHDPAS